MQSARRFAPLIVTLVPPAAGPLAGETCVIDGVVGGSSTSMSIKVTAFPRTGPSVALRMTCPRFTPLMVKVAV